ncbi:alkaline phosphatase [Fretibacter rubidus]|uniref:alkaline phosphatase D family protein n=1 Tax=Fretibacter rubidus TaxID=570162 RepID=UPI00352B139D
MPHNMTRRQWLLGSTLTGLSTSLPACTPADAPMLSSNRPFMRGTFAHGIASGDPRRDAVVLWTRVTPDDMTDGPVSVLWHISENEDFEPMLRSGVVKAEAANNWTAKVDVTALPSGKTLYYRFIVGDVTSPTGQTKTLPDGPLDKLRFAVVSCANWQHGFFNAYDHIARQDDFDAVIHLGDYFYEYGADGIADTPMGQQGRLHDPRHEIISLNDYRTRHAQYRTDPNLQAMSAKFPMITIWDDHETTNDSWQGGAQNHQADEGDWDARKQAAMRAYYEWMPIRDPERGRARETLFRNFDYGDLLSLVSVETRLTARAEPIILEDHVDTIETDPEGFKGDVLGDPSREMFGQVQEDFIVEALTQSKADGKTWRVLANQVIMGRLNTPDLEPYVSEEAVQAIEKDWAGVRDMVKLSKYNLPVYPDSWDGYPAARDRFYDRLNAAGVNDMLVLTGDAHEFWINDLTTQAGDKIGLECVTTSVSSETLIKYMGDSTADYSLLLTQSNKDARYYNALQCGYVAVSFTKDKADISMMGLSTVTSKDYSAFEVAGFSVRAGETTLKASRARGLNLKQKALFSGLG